MIKAIETSYNGYRFRSRAEARWAVFFDTAGIRYRYELEGFELPCGRYLPDFYLPDLDYWFEVKGQQPTPDEITRCGFLYDATSKSILIAVGPPEPNPQIIHIPLILTDKEAESLSIVPKFYIAEDRRNANEFWLLDPQGEARWLGPSCGPDHGKLPLVHRATERAYAASRAARFGD